MRKETFDEAEKILKKIKDTNMRLTEIRTVKKKQTEAPEGWLLWSYGNGHDKRTIFIEDDFNDFEFFMRIIEEIEKYYIKKMELLEKQFKEL